MAVGNVNSIKNYFNVETTEERAARQASLCVEELDTQGTEQADHVERTDHGEHATPRRVLTPGPNIASVDFVRSLHMIRTS